MPSRRRVSALVSAVAVAAAALGTAGSAQAAPGVHPSTAYATPFSSALPARQPVPAPQPPLASPARYLVRVTTTDTGVGARIARVIRASRGSVVSLQETLGTVVIAVTPAAATAVAALPGVVSVSPDTTARTQSLGFAASSQPGPMTTSRV